MIISSLMKAGAVALLAIGFSATTASAVTVLDDGGIYQVGPGFETQFIGNVADANAGAGSWMVTFESTRAGGANALVTIGDTVASTFENLTLEWRDAATNSLLTSIAVTPVVTSLSTKFLTPDLLDQKLMLTWTDSLANAGFDIEVSVSAVPLPFAGMLLLSGIAGLGVLRHRQNS